MEQSAASANLKQVGSTAAFATYIDEYVVPDHEALNTGIVEALTSWRDEADSKAEGIHSSNRLGWHSARTFFARTEAPLVLLQRHIKTALTHSAKRYWQEFDPTKHLAACDGWVNVNRQGAFNAPHDHGGAHLSGVYYVAVPESDDRHSGALEFLNPAGAASAQLPNGRPMMMTRVLKRPRAGWMVIFPSYLRHWVYPNQEDADRVSIAFNLKLLDLKPEPSV